MFQRRPNWCAPLNNGPISDEEMADIRARYDEIFATCAAHARAASSTNPTGAASTKCRARSALALWDKLYDEPGFGIWLGNFREIFTDEAANAEFSEYIADTIRAARARTRSIAEKLIPKDHGFGVQRVPLETRYFEAYNRANVHLVDIARDADRAHHADGHSHERARLRVRHHRLRHRLRRHHRRVRPHRHQRRRRREAARQVARRPDHLPRHAGARLSEPDRCWPGRRAARPRRTIRAASRTASTGRPTC